MYKIDFVPMGAGTSADIKPKEIELISVTPLDPIKCSGLGTENSDYPVEELILPFTCSILQHLLYFRIRRIVRWVNSDSPISKTMLPSAAADSSNFVAFLDASGRRLVNSRYPV